MKYTPDMPDFPDINTIVGIMDNDCSVNETHAMAAVRDGDPSIEVLLMMHCGQEHVRYIDQDDVFSLSHVPDAENCITIAKQKLRLPHVLCSPWKRADQTIEELERRNQMFTEWQQSPWLRGELILLLDEDRKTELCGYDLYYDSHSGLHCTKGGC